MTKPRRLTRGRADAVDRVARVEVPVLVEVVGRIRDQPGRMIRNPCGDPESCTPPSYCFGTEA